jgi:hypothetical protein
MKHRATSFSLLFLFSISTITMILPGRLFGNQQIVAEEIIERYNLEEEAEFDHFSLDPTHQFHRFCVISNKISDFQKGRGMGFGLHDCQYTIDLFSPPEQVS